MRYYQPTIKLFGNVWDQIKYWFENKGEIIEDVDEPFSVAGMTILRKMHAWSAQRMFWRHFKKKDGNLTREARVAMELGLRKAADKLKMTPIRLSEIERASGPPVTNVERARLMTVLKFSATTPEE